MAKLEDHESIKEDGRTCINVSNETLSKVVGSIDKLYLFCMYVAENIVLSTIHVMPFHMKKAS